MALARINTITFARLNRASAGRSQLRKLPKSSSGCCDFGSGVAELLKRLNCKVSLI